MTRRELQEAGESAAATLLERQGMKIVARNWRCRIGELDLVAMQGGEIVFVEVKARASDSFVDPWLGVDHRKQLKLRRLAEVYLALERPSFRSCRFDVVSVVVGLRPKVVHIRDAF